MIAKHWLWQSLSWPDLSEALEKKALAILPLGAIEQHGPHLPLDTDTIIAQGILSEALELVECDTPILVLPTVAVGHSPEHAMFPGTLSLDAQTALQCWQQIAQSALNSGLKRLLIFNAHGGQKALCEIIAQQLRCNNDARIVSCNADDLGLPQELLASQTITSDEQRIGLHAGQVETALMLALSPSSVQLSLAQNFASSREDLTQNNQALCSGGCARYAWLADELNESGAVGNAAAATSEQGEKILEHRAIMLARVIQEAIALPLLG